MSPDRAPASLADFELLVLLAALRLGADEAYTVSIADHIQQRTGRSVRRANVYTTLQRLEAKRLVSTGWASRVPNAAASAPAGHGAAGGTRRRPRHRRCD